jgi:coiled-coil domain-containing protein 55
VFDYDGVYDSLQQQKVQPKQQEKIARQSRYIAQLKDQAEKGKKEDDIAFERKQLKVTDCPST